MKVIDLLNTPLNELPRKIKIEDKAYTLFVDEDTNYHYYQNDECKYFMFSISCFEELNEEVEIIEEDKKIEKIKQLCEYPNTDTYECWNTREEILVKKINEIIDKINKMEDK